MDSRAGVRALKLSQSSSARQDLSYQEVIRSNGLQPCCEVGRILRSLLLFRPDSSAVINVEDLNSRFADSIHDDVGEARDNEFPCAGDSSDSASGGESLKRIRGLEQCLCNALSRELAVLPDVKGNLFQISRCGGRPSNLHWLVPRRNQAFKNRSTPAQTSEVGTKSPRSTASNPACTPARNLASSTRKLSKASRASSSALRPDWWARRVSWASWSGLRWTSMIRD